MKPIKIIHLSDVHFSRENQGKALLALNTVLEAAEKEQPDLFVISGDLFDRSVNNTASSGFPELVRVIKHMMNIAPVVAVYGTPTHDIPGCYEMFREIDAKHNFTVLKAGKPYFLDEGGHLYDKAFKVPRLLTFGCPEPSKEWFLKDKQLGKAGSDEAIKEGMRSLLLGMGALRKQYPDIPCVLVYHGSVEGKTLNNVQSLPAFDIEIGREDLALVGADYYALGHISAFPIDWGELNQKGFNVVEFESLLVGMHPGTDKGLDHNAKIKYINFPFPPRKKIVVDWPLSADLGEIEGYDVWLQIRATKEERHTLLILRKSLTNYGY